MEFDEEHSNDEPLTPPPNKPYSFPNSLRFFFTEILNPKGSKAGDKDDQWVTDEQADSSDTDDSADSRACGHRRRRRSG